MLPSPLTQRADNPIIEVVLSSGAVLTYDVKLSLDNNPAHFVNDNPNSQLSGLTASIFTAISLNGWVRIDITSYTSGSAQLFLMNP
jgi:hypothetical protein